jgi:hypothetical protein
MRKLSLAVIMLCLSLAGLFSQVVVPDSVIRQAESIITNDSGDDFSAFLSGVSSSQWYSKLEIYLLKRARQLVIDNRFDTARALSLALIDNNLDNTEAVELYQSVQKAITSRDEAEQKAGAAAATAAYKQQQEESKIKEESAKTYQTITNTATGKKVYLDQDFDTYYRTITWDAMVGLVNLSWSTGTPAGSGAKYGVSVGGSAFRHGETITIGGEVDASLQVLALGENKLVDWAAQAVVSAAKNSISPHAMLRTGVAVLGYDRGDELIEPRTFVSAVAGFGFRDVAIGNTGRLALSCDWYPGHLLSSDITLAIGANMLAAFVLADMQSFNVYFYSGIRDTVIIYNSMLRNDIKLTLAIGVGDYE